MADTQATQQTPAPQQPATPPPAAPATRPSREEIVKAAIASATAAQETPPEATPALPPTTEPKQETKPDAPPAESRSRAWLEKMRADRERRDATKAAKEASQRAKEADEAMALLRSDPVQFAKRFGGEDFGNRYVRGLVKGDEIKVEEEIAALKGQLAERDERERRAENERRFQQAVGEYRGNLRADMTSRADAMKMRGFYTDEEIENIAVTKVLSHAQATGEDLTHSDVLDSLAGEFVERITNFSKTEAGKQFLRTLIGAQQPAQAAPKAPVSQTTAPKTLSSEFDSTPGPTTRRMSRDEIIAQAIRDHVQA